MTQTWKVAVVAVGLAMGAATAALAQETVFPSSEQRRARRLLERNKLPERTRGFLRDTMKHHGRNMERLTLAAVVLDYPQVQAEAQAIATQPRLSAEAAATVELPPDFLARQEALRNQARSLADAARESSPTKVSSALGTMLNTCVQCHASLGEAPRQP